MLTRVGHHRRPASRPFARRLLLESLESRQLLAAVPSAAFVPGEILIGFDGDLAGEFHKHGVGRGLQVAAARLGSVGIEQGSELMLGAGSRGDEVITHWKVTDGRDVAAVARQLAQLPGVAYAEPNYVWSAAAAQFPNDPSFGSLWGLHNTGQSSGTLDADIDAPEAWGVFHGTGAVVVGVIDTGINYTHADLAANIWTNPGEVAGNGIDDDNNGYVDDIRGYDFVGNDNNPMDDNGHGTHVAGTIGAVGNNGTGVVGVNWNVKLMPLKFLDSAGSGTTENAIRAVNYATQMRNLYLSSGGTQGANVVVTNNSWGGGQSSAALQNAITASGNAGMLFVAAAGNDGRSRASYPARYPNENIISVAATDRNDQLVDIPNGPFGGWGSNYGPDVDIGAPGLGIYSTYNSGYANLDGTSMATPHVAGTAALVWEYLLSQGDTANYAVVREALLQGGDPIPALAGKVTTGSRLNASGALLRAAASTTHLSIDDASVVEGDAGTTTIAFTVSRSGRLDSTTELDWTTDAGTASAGSDFTSSSSHIIFAPGVLTQVIEVSVTGDEDLEPDEAFSVALSNVTNRLGGADIRHQVDRGTAKGTIRTDDVQPVFDFADFSGAAGALNLISSAVITQGGRLRLTPAVSGQAGAAWYTADKPLVAGYFETTFQFQLSEGSDASGTDGSDGFVFLIQNSSSSELRGGGGGLGYAGLPNSVAIEFDTWQNSDLGDPSKSHISVHTNGAGPNSTSEAYSLGAYSTPGFLLDDAQVHTARIVYSAGTISVYLDNLTTPVITAPLDLAATLNLDGGRAWIGFTGVTGGGYQNHDILSWSANNVRDLIIANGPVMAEGASETNLTATFTIRRTGNLSGSAVVDWNTVDGTATEGSDYVAAEGQVSFAVGESEKTVPISLIGDDSIEPHETFQLSLTTVANYVALGGKATITNDDATLSISDGAATEGSAAFRFTDNFVAPDGYGLATARNIEVGPDDNIYVASHDTDAVKIFERGTGRYLRDLVTAGGELDGPWGMRFGPDGRLYVGGRHSLNILRFDTATGNYDVFVPAAASGGLGLPRGLAFDSDGDLYVSSRVGGQPTTADTVKRYSGATGAYLGDFITSGDGGLNSASGIDFGPDGNLYVTSTVGRQILRYDGNSGAFLDVFIDVGAGGLGNPNLAVFHTDGYLYVGDGSTPQVLRYNATTGAFVDVVAPTLGISAIGLAFPSAGEMLVVLGTGMAAPGSLVRRYATADHAAFTVSLSAVLGNPASVQFTTNDDTAVAGVDYTDFSGALDFAPGETSRTVLVQSIDNTIHKANQTFVVALSASSGADVLDGQGLGTISDNDQPPLAEVRAVSETRVFGAPPPVGAYLRTHNADNTVETLTEELYSGNKRSRLEHSWRFDGVTSGDTVELLVAATHLTSNPVETFAFAYSTNGVNWVALGNLGPASFALPNTLSGTVYVRVTDTDRSANEMTLNTLAVDQLVIRTSTAGGSSLAAAQASNVGATNAAIDAALLLWLTDDLMVPHRRK